MKRRAVTLGISLTPELASEVARRVESGLYTSASELVREALRLLLRNGHAAGETSVGVDASVGRDGPGSPALPAAQRFEVASGLMDSGRRIARSRAAPADPSEAAAQRRLRELRDAQEAGPGLRIARDRLERLTDGESS